MPLLSSVKSFFVNDRKDLSSNAPNLFLNCCEFIPDLPKMPTKGSYPRGVPDGLIIHYTAGNRDQSAHAAIQNAIAQKHCYFFIDAQGKIYQQFDLDRWGAHAGESRCPVTNRINVSRFYAGVEVACAGKLNYDGDRYTTWFGKTIPLEETRKFEGSYTQPFKGVYQKFTLEQETALLTLSLAFMKLFGISEQFILGHDEIAPYRKSDPGGSLSCTMSHFRNILKERINSFSDLA